MQIPATMSLLLVSVSLMGTLQVQSYSIGLRDLFAPEIPLDMAPASFDDQYVGCTAAMRKALPALNNTEFQTNKAYANVWTQSSRRWYLCRDRGKYLPPGFRDEHGVALLAYSAESDLYREFNAAVRDGGRDRDYYLKHFNFKTFHFLLTEALQLIVNDQGKSRCHQVYRGVRNLQFKPSGTGVTVRLGGFTSTSVNKKKAEEFGRDTFFDIKTCLGAPIWGYSCFPTEEEVLIPPYETFQVVNISKPDQGRVNITLQALSKQSNYNCEYLKALG